MSSNRIDAEVSTLKKQLELRASHNHGGDGDETNTRESAAPTIEVRIAAPTCSFNKLMVWELVECTIRVTFFSIRISSLLHYINSGFRQSLVFSNYGVAS